VLGHEREQRQRGLRRQRDSRFGRRAEEVAAISAGDAYACARLSNGQIKCWGWNEHGELGDGTTNGHYPAVAVKGISHAVDVSTGIGEFTHHACAILAGGKVKCWGANSEGELGNGKKAYNPTPVSTSGITDAATIGAGDDHTCASLSDHTVQVLGPEQHRPVRQRKNDR